MSTPLNNVTHLAESAAVVFGTEALLGRQKKFKNAYVYAAAGITGIGAVKEIAYDMPVDQQPPADSAVDVLMYGLGASLSAIAIYFFVKKKRRSV